MSPKHIHDLQSVYGQDGWTVKIEFDDLRGDGVVEDGDGVCLFITT